MLLDRLTPAWQSLERRLRSQCLVLISHPEAHIVDFLANELSRRDVSVEIVDEPILASRLRQEDYSVAVTAPGVRGPDNSSPQDWFVVSGDETCVASESLRAGAIDVTLSLGSQKHALLRRLTDRVTDRTAERVLDLVVRDMVGNLEEAGFSELDVADFETRLAAYRRRLSRRPALAVVDARRRAAVRLAEELSHRVRRQTVSASPETMLKSLGGPVCPLVAAVPAQMPGSRQLAASIAKSSSGVELLVLSHHGPERSPNLPWSDWAQLGVDDQNVIAARVRILWQRAKRRLLYQQLLVALTDALGSRPRRSTGDTLYDGFDVSYEEMSVAK